MLASEFLVKIKSLSNDDLSDVKGLGDILISNLLDFTSSDRCLDLINKFEKIESDSKGVNIVTATKVILDTRLPLYGEVVCITGTFDKPRGELQKLLESKGAKVVDSVTKNTTLLLVGDDAGSKLAKAEKLGIKIENNYSSLL